MNNELGVILETGSGKYLKFSEEPEVKFFSDWRQASDLEYSKWIDEVNKEKIISYHNLGYVRRTLEFVPITKLLDPFGSYFAENGE